MEKTMWTAAAMIVGSWMAWSVLTGCTGRDVNVVLAPPGASPHDGAGSETGDAWEALATPDAWRYEDARFQPHYREAGTARRAPVLTVRDADGRSVRLNTARPDRLTLLVFWSLDSWVTRAAVVHVNDLMRRYEEQGVRAIAVVENPETYDQAAPFLRTNDVEIGTFYDDFSALHRMQQAAGLARSYELPFFVFIDSGGRIRLFKRGFRPAGVADETREGLYLTIHESAPRGERLEDYLRRILDERP